MSDLLEARVKALEKTMRSILESDAEWFNAPPGKMTEWADIHADRMNAARELLGIEPMDYDPPTAPYRQIYIRDDQ